MACNLKGKNMRVIPVIHNNMIRFFNRMILGCTPSGWQLFAVFVVFVWPLISVAKDSGEYLQGAQAYFNRGEYQSAVVQLKNALLINPENAEARFLLGRTYLTLDNGFLAEKELSRAQDLGMSRDRVLMPLGRAWILTGESERVLQTIFVEDGDLLPLKIDILLLQGKAYIEEQQPAMADQKFNEVLELKPDATEALVGKARISYQKRDMVAADKLLERALSTDPDFVDAWNLKGELLLRTEGKQQEAAAAFQKALDMKPDSGPARLGLATALIARGENEKALAEVNQVLGKYPNSHLGYYIKALALYQQERLKPAQASVQKALNYNPAHLPSQVLAGTIAYQQGEMNQAEQHLRTYWNQAPRDRRVAVLLAATLLKLKEPAKAIEVLEPGLSAASEDTQYLALLGSAYLADGKSAQGIEYLEKAVELSPDAATVHAQLAMGRLAAGDLDSAVSELVTVVDLDQELVQGDVLLIITYLHKKDFEKALVSAEVLMGKMPESPIPYNFKGAAQFGTGDTHAAKLSYEAALQIQPDFLAARMNLAKLDLLANDTVAAEKQYQKVLSYDEGNLKALLGLAVVAHRNGQVDKTLKWLKEAHDYHPKSIQPALLLIEHYERTGETTKALDLARNMIVTHPRDPTLLKLMARIQLKAGENKEATATLQKLAEVLPNSPGTQYQLAMVQIRQKQTDAARNSLQQAIKLQEDFPQAQAAMGRLEIARDEYDAALGISAALQKNHPNAVYGYELKGDVHAARSESKQAADAYALAYDNGPGAPLAQKLFHSRMKTGDTESAYETLRQWLADHQEDTSNRRLLAITLQSKGQQQSAIEEYLKILEHDPDDVVALNNLAWLYQEKGNPEGVKYAERAHGLAPERIEITDTLGWLLVQNGEINRGLVLLQEARVKAPHIPSIHYHMAVALYKSGRTDEARKELDRLLKTSKDFQGVDDARKLREQLGG